MTSEQIEFDRNCFFDFFRRRVANIEALGAMSAGGVDSSWRSSVDADQHVLIATGLDSLANHWAKTTGIRKLRNGERFARFLSNHGSHLSFDRLAIPHLLARAVREQRNDMTTRFQGWMRGFAHGLVRKWPDDPETESVLNSSDSEEDREWIRRSGYGRVLYSDYRCGWLHEFQAPALASDYDASTKEPRYQNLSTFEGTPVPRLIQHRRPYFPKDFLLETYRRAVGSFERECKDRGTCPPLD
jgi:hypothetical protein